MPFVQFISFRSRAVIAALGLALAALAAPCAAHAGALDTQARETEQAVDATAIDDASTADAIASNVTALDDRVLADQRGTGVGLMTIAASAQASGTGPSVTLWDEIAPPAPVPVPVDTSHVAQSNAVSYFRK